MNRSIIRLKCQLDEECPVCYSGMLGKPAYQLRCGHTFHVACIAKWKRGSSAMRLHCPLCRCRFAEEDPPREPAPFLVFLTNVHGEYGQTLYPEEEEDRAMIRAVLAAPEPPGTPPGTRRRSIFETFGETVQRTPLPAPVGTADAHRAPGHAQPPPQEPVRAMRFSRAYPPEVPMAHPEPGGWTAFNPIASVREVLALARAFPSLLRIR